MKIKRVGNHELPMPTRATPGSGGYDLQARSPATIWPGEYGVVPLGFAIEIHPSHVAMIVPRSGLARKHGITLLNSPGIIDWDYRGEIQAILINHSDRPFDVNVGDRIAQMIIVPVNLPRFSEHDDLEETERGANGFGSTGR